MRNLDAEGGYRIIFNVVLLYLLDMRGPTRLVESEGKVLGT